MSNQLPIYNHKAVRAVECLGEGWELIKGNYWLFMVSFAVRNFATFAVQAMTVIGCPESEICNSVDKT